MSAPTVEAHGRNQSTGRQAWSSETLKDPAREVRGRFKNVPLPLGRTATRDQLRAGERERLGLAGTSDPEGPGKGPASMTARRAKEGAADCRIEPGRILCRKGQAWAEQARKNLGQTEVA